MPVSLNSTVRACASIHTLGRAANFQTNSHAMEWMAVLKGTAAANVGIRTKALGRLVNSIAGKLATVWASHNQMGVALALALLQERGHHARNTAMHAPVRTLASLITPAFLQTQTRLILVRTGVTGVKQSSTCS